jgi:hypothetical protein
VAGATLSVLAPGWEAMKDPTSGKSYYHHAASGDTAWDRPSVPIDADSANAEAHRAMEESEHAQHALNEAATVRAAAVQKEQAVASEAARSSADARNKQAALLGVEQKAAASAQQVSIA